MEECTACNNSPVLTTEPINETCPAVGFQKVSVCVPVTVKPFANPGRTKTKCCGEPTVYCQTDDCSYTCKVVITQTICVNIPIQYELTACTGDCSIECCACD